MGNRAQANAFSVNWSYTPRQSPLPPKSPFPTIGPAFADYSPSPLPARRFFQAGGREGLRQHQRTSSESILIEEQPSWLDDLLSEPETPVKKGTHRRSVSDTVAFMDLSTTTPQTEGGVVERNLYDSSAKLLETRRHLDSEKVIHNSYQAKHKKPPIKGWDVSGLSYKNALNNGKDRKLISPSSSSHTQDSEGTPLSSAKREDIQERKCHDNTPGLVLERRESSQGKPAETDAESKRAKQQFAQRSRVRKLQYISELERNVNALQAEELEVSAEVAFLSQQRVILTLENQALKQRIAGLAQEKFFKDAEHELLVKEAQSLKLLYNHQQLRQQQSSMPSTSVEHELQQLQFSSKLNLGSSNQVESKSSTSRGNFVMSTVTTGSDNEMALKSAKYDASKNSISSCMFTDANKNIERIRMVPGGGLMPVDFVLPNSYLFDAH